MARTSQKARKSTGGTASHKALGSKVVARAKTSSSATPPILPRRRSSRGVSASTKTRPSPTRSLLPGTEVVPQAVQVRLTLHSLLIRPMGLWFDHPGLVQFMSKRSKTRRL